MAEIMASFTFFKLSFTHHSFRSCAVPTQSFCTYERDEEIKKKEKKQNLIIQLTAYVFQSPSRLIIEWMESNENKTPNNTGCSFDLRQNFPNIRRSFLFFSSLSRPGNNRIACSPGVFIYFLFNINRYYNYHYNTVGHRNSVQITAN